MNEDMHKAEATLGAAGQRCNSRAVEKLFGNHKKFKETQDLFLKERYALPSEVLLLQKCTTAMARLLASGKSHLVAAKVLVLSRLTYKTLSTHSHAPPIIANLHRRLAGLRRKLLKGIDKKLASRDLETHELVEEMCAFSLATSSTPTEVLRHFLHVRVEAIAQHIKENGHGRENIVKAMDLYISTLRHAHHVFPKRLAEGLTKIRGSPLIQQRDLRALSELELEVHETWIANELRNYTPWPRHDDLQTQDAQRQLRAWAQSALKVFLKEVKSALEEQTDIKDLMEIRKEILEAWPWSSSSRLPGLGDPSEVVDELRDLLNAQLKRVVHQSLSKLACVPDAISETLTANNLPGTAQSFWNSGVITSDISGGAENFRRTIIDIYHGNTEITEAIATLYNNWISNVASIRAAIKAMKELRWDDDLGAAEDDEDFDLDDKQVLLSDDDPKLLEQALKSSLDHSFQRFNEKLLRIVRKIEVANESTPEAAMFLLRVLRNIRRQAELSQEITQPDLPPSIIQPLQQHLSKSVLDSALSAYRRSARREASAPSLLSRSLWEGQPPLPVQPSPSAFICLKSITANMASTGSDLWSPGTVNVLKVACERDLGTILGDVVTMVRAEPASEHDAAPPNGHPDIVEDAEHKGVAGDEAQPENDSPRKEASLASGADEDDQADRKALETEKLVQLSFDALYLQRALSTNRLPNPDSNPMNERIDQLLSDIRLDEATQGRLKKSAAEYWKRTYLLFGLLA